MTDFKKDRTTDDVLQDLHQFLQGESLGIDSLSDEDVSAELAKRGIDGDKSFTTIAEMLGDALVTCQLAEARQLREEKIAKQQPHPKLATVCREKIMEFLNLQQPSLAAGYFSKLESCEDEDLESFMEDLHDLGIRDFIEDEDATTNQ